MTLDLRRIHLDRSNVSQCDILHGTEERETVPWNLSVCRAVDECVDGVRRRVDLARAVDLLKRRTVDHGRVQRDDFQIVLGAKVKSSVFCEGLGSTADADGIRVELGGEFCLEPHLYTNGPGFPGSQACSRVVGFQSAAVYV